MMGIFHKNRPSTAYFAQGLDTDYCPSTTGLDTFFVVTQNYSTLRSGTEY